MEEGNEKLAEYASYLQLCTYVGSSVASHWSPSAAFYRRGFVFHLEVELFLEEFAGFSIELAQSGESVQVSDKGNNATSRLLPHLNANQAFYLDIIYYLFRGDISE